MERKITEAHVTLENTTTGGEGINRVTSTFRLSNPIDMQTMESIVYRYIRDRKVFTVTYS